MRDVTLVLPANRRCMRAQLPMACSASWGLTEWPPTRLVLLRAPFAIMLELHARPPATRGPFRHRRHLVRRRNSRCITKGSSMAGAPTGMKVHSAAVAMAGRTLTTGILRATSASPGATGIRAASRPSLRARRRMASSAGSGPTGCSTPRLALAIGSSAQRLEPTARPPATPGLSRLSRALRWWSHRITKAY